MLKNILRNHLVPFGFTCSLIIAEALLTLLFPLFIGYAIDGAINGSHLGILQLGALGLITLLVGASRRFFDSRFYAKVYQEIGPKVISGLKEKGISIQSARLDMAKELVEFLEYSLPELIQALITLVGVIVLVATLNLNVFWGALLTTVLISLVYWISRTRTLHFNKASNEQQEKQVEVIAQNDPVALKNHLQKSMHWNVKLSDLETLNFSTSWLILVIFLLASIVIAIDSQIVQYGALFSLIVYVFQYMEQVINIPFFYQNLLRLQEITDRLFKG